MMYNIFLVVVMCVCLSVFVCVCIYVCFFLPVCDYFIVHVGRQFFTHIALFLEFLYLSNIVMNFSMLSMFNFFS